MQKEQKTGRFCDLGIDERFLSILTKKGFNIPTPIQSHVIPGALEGRDVIGIAQTGTGKTLAFGIPMINHLINSNGQGLILVPTRELAIQVERALKDVGGPLGLQTAVVIGGASQYLQKKDLKRNPHIVVATPGRLDDLIKQGVYKLNRLTMVTLDEADRMLDDGFLPQIKKILSTAPAKRQTMLFSATMPKSIASLAGEFMNMPMRVEIAQQGTSAENIEHELFMIAKNNKMRLLDALLEEYKSNTVLIFSRTKHGAKRIARDIRGMGHTATEIHSNRSQAQRRTALDGFTNKRFRVMVATDIAARGIDVRHISLVINFDLPDCTEDYVHRIGRTGRAGRSGKAISFVNPSQRNDVRKIERLMRKKLPMLDLPDLPEARPKLAYEPEFSGSGRSSYARSNGGGYRGRNRRSGGGGNSGGNSYSRHKRRGSSYAKTGPSSSSSGSGFGRKKRSAGNGQNQGKRSNGNYRSRARVAR
ncbi:MAG: DEAD/DEAH box helicase [Candidatus Magasanikbacteria bacterium]|nr:DEAD/DEAH box helicase [Candidatus Magasanikbacteria bacterium]